MEALLKPVLKDIKPSKKEKKRILKIAKSVLKQIKIPSAKAKLGGSMAKNTWLHKNHDIDIYVLFDYKKYKDDDISKILKKELKKKFKLIKELHGSRDYFQIKKENYEIEIVPIIKIKQASEALNITDISPLHVKWVRKNKKYADEMRLAKAFFKANQLYGAESYIKGFSGYVLEILVAYYRGFIPFLSDAAKWNKNIRKIIDVEEHYEGKNILDELNISKTLSPLILIDPVQKERNAAAGLSRTKYSQFIDLAQQFLSKPSADYFFKTIMTKEEIKKKPDVIIIEAKPMLAKKDVAGAKLLKVFEYLKKELEDKGFTLKDAGWEWNHKALFWFVPAKKRLGKVEKHMGPCVDDKESVKKFKSVWKGYRMLRDKDKNRVYVMKKRKYLTPHSLLRHLIRTDYVRKKVKEIDL